ncbi:ABC transporter substrate-binding protein [Natrarchaeobius oligotrophus]|nr:ABC transporter substrate-binding protein [Natrarchaeobius chitinivorans]
MVKDGNVVGGDKGFRIDRRSVLSITGTSAFVGLAGCAGGDNGESDDTTDDTTDDATDDTQQTDDVLPDTLVIGNPSPAYSSANIPAFSAFSDRMEERGVSVDVEVFNDFTAVIASLMTEDIHFGFMEPVTLINSHLEGFPVVSFMELAQRITQVVVSQPEIEDWEELRGETLLAHAPQSFSALALQLAVEENLGSVDAVDYSYVAGTPNRFSAMEAGEALATTVFPSAGMEAEEQGIGRVLYDPNEHLEPMTMSQWGVLEEQLDNHPEMYQIIVDDMLEAYRDMYESDPRSIAENALDSPAGFPDYSVDVWADTIDWATELDMWPTDLSNMLTDEKMQATMDIAIQTDLLEESVPTEDIVDHRFLE